jgi:outer membrane protein assembly factor BamD (BamD/ComL family)
MTDLRNDAARILKTNFPNSSYAGGGNAAKRGSLWSRWWQPWNW